MNRTSSKYLTSYLEAALDVKPEAEPFTGERRWWQIAGPPPALRSCPRRPPVPQWRPRRGRQAQPLLRAPPGAAAPHRPPPPGPHPSPAVRRKQRRSSRAQAAAPARAFSARRCEAGGPCTSGGCAGLRRRRRRHRRAASSTVRRGASSSPIAATTGPAALPSVLGVPGLVPMAAQPDAYMEADGTYVGPPALRWLPAAALRCGRRGRRSGRGQRRRKIAGLRRAGRWESRDKPVVWPG